MLRDVRRKNREELEGRIHFRAVDATGANTSKGLPPVPVPPETLEQGHS